MAALLEFKAGQVDFNSDTGDAVPLAGQGRVVLKHSSEDPSFLGLQWFPRAKNRGASGEELLLLPGDVEFSHSKECGTGRVVQMQFQSSGERHFFWLQDAPAGDLHELSDKDVEIITRLNDLVNQYDPENDAEDDSMQVDESTPLTKDDSSNHTFEDEQVSRLQSVLSSALVRNVGHTQGQSGQPGQLGQPPQQGQSQQPQLPLSRRFDASARAARVSAADEQELARLLEYTHGTAANRDELTEVVRSPHFASALDGLGQAVLGSPALALEIGLSRQPVSIDDFLILLRELLQNHTNVPLKRD